MPFTIKDIANLSGIKAHTIRIWEQRYSFLKPARTTTNIRYYSDRELQTILNVSLLNKYGYKISHIDRMSDEAMSAEILSLSHEKAEQDRIVNELIKKMIDLDIDNFEKILGQYVSINQIEKTITQLIFPFLERIGILWLTNNINPGQEHIVSNIIRQKIIVGIESIQPTSSPGKTICLFLPEGEYHELGLLFVSYLLKRRGIAVIYLGTSVPINDVEFITDIKKPDYLYTHITTAGKNFNFDKFMLNLSHRFDGITILISGIFTNGYQKKIPSKIKFKKSFKEVIEFIDGL